jgi:alpha-beta hydrolase superfamily lysophospholipase
MRATVAALALCMACAGGRLDVRRPRPIVPVSNGVEHSEDAFEGFGRVRIFTQQWRPDDGRVRGVLVIVHGLRDHSSRYVELAERLAKHGYAVHGFDLRGHGSSGGRREYVESFDEYVADLGIYVDAVRANESGRPLFVLGQDMGGTIALRYALDKKPQLSGVVVSGAILKSTASGFNRCMTRTMGTILPLLAILTVDVDHFSQDPAVVQACKDDPLIEQGDGPARTARELLNAMESIGERAQQMTLPLLILQGGADVVTPPEGSRELYERAGSQDKTLRVFDGMWHDLWREPAREQVMQELSDWLDAR